MKFFISLFLVASYCIATGQILTDKIVVDQFGYRTTAKKHAVLRDPVTGHDAAASYTPGTSFQVIDANSSAVVFSGSAVQWNGGATDLSSGDRAWAFDFSALTSQGKYFILDVQNNMKSVDFEIRDDIYNDVLRQAMRVFFYQRSGHEKLAQFAGSSWADGASHLGALQDLNCRKWDEPGNAATERDVHGG